MQEFRNTKFEKDFTLPILDMIERLWDYKKYRVEEYPAFGGTKAEVYTTGKRLCDLGIARVFHV